MQIGFCGGWDRIGEVKAAGFDYLETSVTGVYGMTDQEFEDALSLEKSIGFPVLRFNVLFPGTFRLLDETRDEDIRAYLDKAFARIHKAGGEVVVFGSGGARKRPESMAYGDAFRKLGEVGTCIADMADRYGITIALEPLNTGETNMINSVAEGAALCAMVHHPRFQLLADYYHVAKEKHDPCDLERVGGICHCHVATSEGRHIPLNAEDGCRQMFGAMKRTGYSGTVSVEGRADDLSLEGPVAVRMLKKLWEEA